MVFSSFVGDNMVNYERNELSFYVHHLNVMYAVTHSSKGHDISPGTNEKKASQARKPAQIFTAFLCTAP